MIKIIGGKEFAPIAESEASNNSLFLDNADNIIKIKDNSGNVKVF